jgi:cytochrome c oxidase subunit 3
MTEKVQTQQRLIHPSSIAIVLVLMGVTALFLSLSIAYIYSLGNGAGDSVKLPWLFSINTFVLLTSSLFFWNARKSYENQSYLDHFRDLSLALIVTTLFLILQIIAWSWMFNNELSMQKDTSHAYLYAISILHFVHVIAGIPFLISYLRKFYLESKKQDGSLFFIDEKASRKLRLISTYWHFIDFLWVYLMLFFAVSSLF